MLPPNLRCFASFTINSELYTILFVADDEMPTRRLHALNFQLLDDTFRTNSLFYGLKGEKRKEKPEFKCPFGGSENEIRFETLKYLCKLNRPTFALKCEGFSEGSIFILLHFL